MLIPTEDGTCPMCGEYCTEVPPTARVLGLPDNRQPLPDDQVHVATERVVYENRLVYIPGDRIPLDHAEFLGLVEKPEAPQEPAPLAAPEAVEVEAAPADTQDENVAPEPVQEAKAKAPVGAKAKR